MLPLIGLGTYKLLGKECEKTVREALEIGYRHIDTAFGYENHKAIGEAIKDFDRSELFITSKFTAERVKGAKGVEKLVHQALKELQVDYLDLMLIHWPEPGYPLQEVYAALFEQTRKGELRSAGVSNYTKHHLQDAYDAGLKIPYNQVEFHPYLYQADLLKFAKAHGTELIAYRPFGKGQLTEIEPLFKEIGQKHGKTAGQVILRWLIQKGIPVVPKASSGKHLRENFNIFDFSLDHREMAALDALNKNQRFCLPDSPIFQY